MLGRSRFVRKVKIATKVRTVSYTHLRAHETLMNLVCRLLLEKKKEEEEEYSPPVASAKVPSGRRKNGILVE